MQEESWRRILEVESWKRNPGGGILEEESWTRNTRTGIIEEESLRRNPERGILKEESQRWNPGGGILEEESQRRNPGRKIPEGALGAPPRSSGGTPRSLLKASGAPLERPGPLSGLRGNCVESIMFFCRKWRDRPFRLYGSEATCTNCRACAQKLIGVNVQIAGRGITQSQSHRQNPYSVNTVWGINTK